MKTHSKSPQDRSSNLPEREQEIAERVRQSLHLSPSMPLDEVADQFRHSAVWRRERMGLAGEELRDRLWGISQPILRFLWGRVRSGWAWLRGVEPNEPSRPDGENGGKIP